MSTSDGPRYDVSALQPLLKLSVKSICFGQAVISGPSAASRHELTTQEYTGILKSSRIVGGR